MIRKVARQDQFNSPFGVSVGDVERRLGILTRKSHGSNHANRRAAVVIVIVIAIAIECTVVQHGPGVFVSVVDVRVCLCSNRDPSRQPGRSVLSSSDDRVSATDVIAALFRIEDHIGWKGRPGQGSGARALALEPSYKSLRNAP